MDATVGLLVEVFSGTIKGAVVGCFSLKLGLGFAALEKELRGVYIGVGYRACSRVEQDLAGVAFDSSDGNVGLSF